MKRRVAPFALVLLAACSSANPRDASDDSTPLAASAEAVAPGEHEEAAEGAGDIVPAAKLGAVRALEAEAGARFAAKFDPTHEVLRRIEALEGPRTGASGRADAVGFANPEAAFERVSDLVARHEGLFGVAVDAIALTRSRTDALGMTHVRVHQTTKGLPVLGRQATFHFDARGALVRVVSHFVPGLEAIEATPRLSRERGVARALVDHGARTSSANALESSDVQTAELVVFAPDGAPPKLAWHVVFLHDGARPARMDYVVDAIDGAILRRFDRLTTQSAGSVPGSGTSVLGETRPLQVRAAGSAFELVDTTRASLGIATHDARQAAPLDFKSLPGPIVTSNDRHSWDAAHPTNPGAAVDAHFYAGVVFDFFSASFGRNSYDGAGARIVSTVHVGRRYSNAYWNGNLLAYGDGDGAQFRSFSAGLDVVAHEFTHAVTESESNLEYVNQSGALNEALSDIFAAFVEQAFFGDETKSLQIGERVVLSGPAFRDLLHPHDGWGGQPTHMAEYALMPADETGDYGGVHFNSGIINNAMALMTVGGRNDYSSVRVPRGIGWRASAALWYHAATEYFTPKTNFVEAAEATLSAARDLGLSSSDRAMVRCAWIATGVLSGRCGAVEASEPDAAADADGDASNAVTGSPGDTTALPKGEVEAGPTTVRAPVISGCSAAPETGDSAPGFFRVLAALAFFLVMVRGGRRWRSASRRGGALERGEATSE
jgi:Zn-dependent metalloprotease